MQGHGEEVPADRVALPAGRAALPVARDVQQQPGRLPVPVSTARIDPHVEVRHVTQGPRRPYSHVRMLAPETRITDAQF